LGSVKSNLQAEILSYMDLSWHRKIADFGKGNFEYVCLFKGRFKGVGKRGGLELDTEWPKYTWDCWA